MNRKSIRIILFLFLALSPSLYSQDRTRLSFLDRSSLKTNVFEWLVTVPNFGVEFDVVRTEFKKMSLSLTGKCNWNTFHSLAPSTVFDMADVRPEFRYYFRTRNMKVSRPWLVMYLGPYMSYGTYTFKFGEKGIRGSAAGVGVSAGYVLPMYEYKKGAIDVDFGLSVGLQMCTRDVFSYNPEGYYYSKIESESRPMHFTPFPVLSEVRVAFVWRKESIRHQAHIDDAKLQKKENYSKYLKLMNDDIEANLPLSLALEYSDLEKLDKELGDRKTYLMGENAIGSAAYDFTRPDVKRLKKKVEARCKEVRRVFLKRKSNGGKQ